MQDLAQVPEWLGAALVGAIIAALGYVAKQIVELLSAIRSSIRVRFAQLVELNSLLRAAWVSFVIQNSHAERLLAMIRENHQEPLPPDGEGYERVLSAAFPKFTSEERELHAIIRGITINSMRPVNQQLSDWLKRDTYFKTRWGQKGVRSELARKLADLEAHLLLWHAKYETWIPQQPEHALVYLADEQKHGLGFPTGIDKLVIELLEARQPSGRQYDVGSEDR